MTSFGLIGKSLGHSFSKPYFEKKFEQLQLHDHQFINFELAEISQLNRILEEHPNLKGLSVTIPYKTAIIPYLSDISPEAAAVGAVNCVKVTHGRLSGHNTDVYGFAQSIKPFLDANHERALILGTGGAAKAVAYALKKVGLEISFVTSSSEKKEPHSFFYPEINQAVMNAFKLVVNATPLGMFPQTAACPPLPYEHFTPQHLAYDLIYNPPQTLFLKKAAESGAATVNGLSMLQLQAEKAWEIWHAD